MSINKENIDLIVNIVNTLKDQYSCNLDSSLLDIYSCTRWFLCNDYSIDIQYYKNILSIILCDNNIVDRAGKIVPDKSIDMSNAKELSMVLEYLNKDIPKNIILLYMFIHGVTNWR